MPQDEHITDSNNEALPSVIEYITQSGVLIHVTPLSIFTLQALRHKAEEQYPYPAKVDYQVPSEVTATGYLPAEENPDYVAACKVIDGERGLWIDNAVLDLACAYPQFPNRESMQAHFAPRLLQLSKYFELSGDDWADTLEHCVFTRTSIQGRSMRNERVDVVSLALQQSSITLSIPEVMDGLRVFRLALPGG